MSQAKAAHILGSLMDVIMKDMDLPATKEFDLQFYETSSSSSGGVPNAEAVAEVVREI